MFFHFFRIEFDAEAGAIGQRELAHRRLAGDDVQCSVDATAMGDHVNIVDGGEGALAFRFRRSVPGVQASYEKLKACYRKAGISERILSARSIPTRLTSSIWKRLARWV